VSAKYKVLKISKEIGDTKAIGPGMSAREAAELAKVGAELVEVSDANKSDVIEAAKDADIILCGSVPISRWIVEALPKCKAIVTQSVGYDHIDVEAATEHNIVVVNNPAFAWCVEEVSNHAILLLLACAKKLTLLESLVRQGRWAEAKKAQPPMGSVFGETLGIVGCGAIGRMTARKAKCFGLTLLGYDPYVEEYLAKENGIQLVEFSELLQQSDYVSLHPDLNPTSFHMMDEKAFSLMKPSAFLINTARGKVVDEAALIKALEEKRIAGAGLDVFEVEPPDKDNPLLKMDNVALLPHSASFSDYAFALAPINMTEEVGRILCGRLPKNVVNKSVKPRFEVAKEA